MVWVRMRGNSSIGLVKMGTGVSPILPDLNDFGENSALIFFLYTRFNLNNASKT